jgi:hypothetical protein
MSPGAPAISIIDALQDPNLIGAAFPNLTSWNSWITALKAAYGLQLDEGELSLFCQCTGRENPPTAPAKELYFIVGRRGGKGRITAAIGVFLAAFQDYSKILAPGEEGLLPIIASDRDQARIVLNYCRDIFLQSPILKKLPLNDDLTWEIPLRNKVSIRVMTASKAAIRGYTLVGAVLEETAYWRVEGANPDLEIVRALRPGRLTTKGPLVVISSPYRRVGVLWEAFRRYYGQEQDGRALVWQAGSLTMNPTLDREEIEEEMRLDPEATAAEYEAQFRSDLEDYLPWEVIEGSTVAGRYEVPYMDDVKTYAAFVDMSGGRQDAAALAVAHLEGQQIILDLGRRWKAPHDPSIVVMEMASVLKSYHLSRVRGDKYAGSWPQAEFAKHGIRYEGSEMSKSDLYLEFVSLIMSGRVDLLEIKQLQNELRGLERRTRSGGKDSVDHGPRGSDDLANAVVGACVLVGSRVSRPIPRVRWL